MFKDNKIILNFFYIFFFGIFWFSCVVVKKDKFCFIGVELVYIGN